MTAEAGLPAYEVSNHARKGEESRHNLTYWRYQDYCGIGPGAHGRRGGIATVRHRKPENWLEAVAAQGDGIAETRGLGDKEQASEAMLMGLRLAEGIDLAALARRFGMAKLRCAIRTSSGSISSRASSGAKAAASAWRRAAWCCSMPCSANWFRRSWSET